MSRWLQRVHRKSGFTLAELLIVLAILGILIAIAIPLFGTQLDQVTRQRDEANMRSAQSMAVMQYMIDGEPGSAVYYAHMDDNHNMTVDTVQEGAQYTISFDAAGVPTVSETSSMPAP